MRLLAYFRELLELYVGLYIFAYLLIISHAVYMYHYCYMEIWNSICWLYMLGGSSLSVVYFRMLDIATQIILHNCHYVTYVGTQRHE